MTLNNESCMIRPILIDLNPIELNICLDKCSGSFHASDDLATKICVSSKTKDICVKLFNVITRINEAKTLIKHVSFEFKCKFNSTTCNSN